MHRIDIDSSNNVVWLAVRDCDQLYDEGQTRLSGMVSGESSYNVDDALAWLGGVLADFLKWSDQIGESHCGVAKNFVGYNTCNLSTKYIYTNHKI